MNTMLVDSFKGLLFWWVLVTMEPPDFTKDFYWTFLGMDLGVALLFL
jgi:hypothetical protein